MVSRRRLLAGGAALVAAPLILRADRTAPRPISGPALPIPPLAEGRLVDGVRVFDLTVRRTIHEFGAGRRGPAIGIDATYGGPTLRMRAGETVRLRVTNRLDETTTLHWHGFHLPAAADGGPHQRIAPGAVWEPSFRVLQKAGLFWYHSHLMGETGRQIYFGQAGPIYVEDEEEAALPLPREYGVDDIPLVVQDRRFDADGVPVYALDPMSVATGYIGDVAVVNGAVSPHFVARRRRLRLRLLNAANASVYRFRFSDGRRFHVIAGDGGLLERPLSVDTLLLAPGERAQILVEIRPGPPFRLEADILAPMMGMHRRGGRDVLRRLHVLRIVPESVLDPAPPPPVRLVSLPRPRPERAVRMRRFVLSMGMGMGMGGMGRRERSMHHPDRYGDTGPMGADHGRHGRGGPMYPPYASGTGRGVGPMGMRFTINGKSMDMDRIDEVVRVGTDEIWEVINRSPMPHPFHVHDVQFRILDRDGRPPDGIDSGLKDTVLVPPMGRVRLLLSFRDYVDPERPYMYHCHILEHEDAGMMGQFVVVA